MTTIRSTDDTWTTPFPCPNCGTTDTRTTKRISNGVITADILCAQGHPFTVRWMVAA